MTTVQQSGLVTNGHIAIFAANGVIADGGAMPTGRFIVSALVFSLALTFSAGAQSVKQSGLVTPGHGTKWITNGVIGDTGAPAGSLLGQHLFTNGSVGTVPFSPPAVFGGTWIGQNSLTASDTATSAAFRSTLNVSYSTTGNGQSEASNIQDIALFVSQEKKNYLSSAIAGNNGAAFFLSAQGINGDTAPIQYAGYKTYNASTGIGGITGFQGAAIWLDPSGNTLSELQLTGGWQIQNGAYPTGGVGIASEYWGATAAVSASQIIPYTLFYGGVLDIFNDVGAGHPPYTTNLIVASGNRTAAHEYFKVVAGLNEAGDVVIGSASATGIDGSTPTQSGGNPLTLKNISGGLGIYFGSTELFALTSAAQIVLDSPSNTSGIFMYAANGNYVLSKPVVPASSYNFNLPNTAGSAGNVLASGGGGSNPMTWISGVTQTCTVNTASPLTLIFTNGVLTGGTCNS